MERRQKAKTATLEARNRPGFMQEEYHEGNGPAGAGTDSRAGQNLGRSLEKRAVETGERFPSVREDSRAFQPLAGPFGSVPGLSVHTPRASVHVSGWSRQRSRTSGTLRSLPDLVTEDRDKRTEGSATWTDGPAMWTEGAAKWMDGPTRGWKTRQRGRMTRQRHRMTRILDAEAHRASRSERRNRLSKSGQKISSDPITRAPAPPGTAGVPPAFKINRPEARPFPSRIVSRAAISCRKYVQHDMSHNS